MLAKLTGNGYPVTIFDKSAARTAGGWLHHPKGGEAYADNFDLTYPWICNYDQG